ncbi:MAG TPA: head GIN domain-containing protein, partial [Flavisolibacter sp.]|nr:head GIN domain-containing protein [Flavisolibacter sp.]
LLIAVSLICIGVSVNAQKVVNDAYAESRTVSSFHAIHISNAFEVIISQDAQEGLAVSANNKEDVPGIKTSVDNGVLKIWFDQKGWWPKNRKLKAYIAIKNIDEIKAGGASNIKIDGSLSSAGLKLDFSGASDLKGKLNVNGLLDIKISGASDVDINGTADEVKIDASGASDVKAYDFNTTNCSVDASGASSIKITVQKELSAKLSGASSVSYKGTAMIRDIKTSGASSISRKS